MIAIDCKNLLEKQELLCAELEQYREELPRLGTCIRHPLVYMVPHHEQLNAWANQMLREKRKQIELATKKHNWSQYIWLHERPYRLDAFQAIEPKLTDQEYWKLLGSVWIDSENIGHRFHVWLRLLKSKRPGREYFMDEEDRAEFAKLPEKLTIYRGYQPGKNAHGISYTLDKAKAEWFAKRFSQNGKVKTKTVAKSEIFAYLGGRNEREVIVWK